MKIVYPLLVLLLCLYVGSEATAQEAKKTVRIQLQPTKEARINSPMSGKVIKVYLKDGERVTKGKTLVKFKCDQQIAQAAQTQARVSRQTQLLNSTQKLFDLGSASEIELGVLNAELEEAVAVKNQISSQVKDCTIKAPFSGRVSSLSVKDHYSVEQGDPLFELVGDGDMEIEMIVPSMWMRWLAPGTAFRIQIDETGRSYSSKLIRLGGRVDPITQSVKAYGAVDQKAPDLLPGMSGQAFFDNIQNPENEAIE